MTELHGVSIHITGIVQGVGFRPFIYSLAVRYGLSGWVRNTSAGVDILVDGAEQALNSFVSSIKSELPPLARIDSLSITNSVAGGFVGFQIIPSEAVAGAFQPISPDVSICPDCRREMLDPSDRRYNYPFINCTNCGPRFTIISDIPYDRPKTTMAAFEMCPDCSKEYSDPLDRRFHAQPVACPVCGPQVWLEDANGNRLATREAAIRLVKQHLMDGKIVAIKGLGGFHLACDATDPKAVSELRLRKLRVDKPFALMMLDLEMVSRYCIVAQKERALLESRQRPIVLLRRNESSGIAEQVAPDQNTLAVMLPYTPLHYLLFSPNAGDSASGLAIPALVMTSGNLAEEPIATDNNEARRRLTSLADYFLMHDRDIQTRCDDSVVRVVDPEEDVKKGNGDSDAFTSSIYFLRRSRGYAPDPIYLPYDIPALLATGPEQKNTFCLTREHYAFISHHIGDMENYETLRSFEDGIEHFEQLFRIRPECIACDLHPDYLSSRYALQRSNQSGLPLIRVQHHHAHIASCMADNGLDGKRPVIGLAFDGTGYGEDGTIWGGEVLVADYSGYQRPYHLAYFPLPGGDAAIKRPARTALAMLWSLGLDWDDRLEPAQGICYEDRLALRIQLEKKLNTPQTSSLGRLFDAVAALAGIRQKVNYEAQAAIEFEAILDKSETGVYHFEIANEIIDYGIVIQNLLNDIYNGVNKAIISARFHNGLSKLSSEVCVKIRKQTGINEVALSGGVWQNMVLLERTKNYLIQNGFVVYLHHKVPANDGGIAIGQALIGATRFAE